MPKTIHFAPMEQPEFEVQKTVPTVPEAPQKSVAKNPLDAYRDAAVDAKLIVETLKHLFPSDNRHGDLEVARTAAKRIVSNLTVLIELEEG